MFQGLQAWARLSRGAFGTITALPLIIFSKPLLILLGAPEDRGIGQRIFIFFVASLPLMILVR